MATAAATRPKSRPEREAPADAVARLLADRVRQGLSRRVSDPVVIARLASALKNGDGNGHVARLTKAEKRKLLTRPPP